MIYLRLFLVLFYFDLIYMKMLENRKIIFERGLVRIQDIFKIGFDFEFFFLGFVFFRQSKSFCFFGYLVDQ